MTTTGDLFPGTCAHSCSFYYEMERTCQCYYGCSNYNDCCTDFADHCDGMAKIEEGEREALAQVAAFSVFYSITMFLALLAVLSWAFYTLYGHCKKHGSGSSFESSGFILRDNKAMLIISYTGMSVYVLSLFCYLISNAALGVEYNSDKDTYGNAQITSIILWFLGHTMFYILFMLKLFYFMRNTTYQLGTAYQCTVFSILIGLWLVSCIVTIIWIDEFHTNYHYGSIDSGKILACMVIAFAMHVWFCLSLVLFFSTVLYRVIRVRGTTLINVSSANKGCSKSELEEKVTQYMTRITVLCTIPLAVSVFCMLCWIILIGTETVGDGFLRFCWWLFPVNVLFGFLSLLLGLNFDPNMNDVYKRVCICPHAFCEFYCVRASMPSLRSNNKGTQVMDYDEDEDEENEDRLVTINTKDREIDEDDGSDDDDEQSSSFDDNIQGNQRHTFNPMNTDQNALKSGE